MKSKDRKYKWTCQLNKSEIHVLKDKIMKNQDKKDMELQICPSAGFCANFDKVTCSSYIGHCEAFKEFDVKDTDGYKIGFDASAEDTANMCLCTLKDCQLFVTEIIQHKPHTFDINMLDRRLSFLIKALEDKKNTLKRYIK